MMPTYYRRFTMRFDNGHTASALHVPEDPDPTLILDNLRMTDTRPTIFITGGASLMSPEDIKRTNDIIKAVAEFAHQHHITILDGGTESGVMQMIGDARRNFAYSFDLVGVSPLGKVSYPGYKNPNEEGFLEDSHSHFVLVDATTWGDESRTLLTLTRTLSGNGTHPAVGILINGGTIAKQEVYLAATREYHLPMLVLEGSGRAADDIANAFKTGRANQRILQAILAGGDIQLVATHEGPEAMRAKLKQRFNVEA